MIIPDKLIKKWSALRSEEDSKIIADNVGVTTQTVRNAFREKKCSTAVFEGMASFYNKKAELVKQYL